MSRFTLTRTTDTILNTQADVRQVRELKFKSMIDEYAALQPKDIKDAFRYLKVVGIGSEVISPALHKISESPITDIVINGDKVSQLKDLFGPKLKVRDICLDLSYDLSLYHNAFAMMYLAPTRTFICKECQKKKEEEKKGSSKAMNGILSSGIGNFKLDKKDGEVSGRCPTCKKSSKFERKERFILSASKLKLLRVSPFSITIDNYPLLSKNVYYYTLPIEEKKRILAGDPEYLDELPWTFIEAAVKDKTIRLNSHSIYHFSPGGFSGAYPGWSLPRGIAAMRILMYLNSLLRSNEVVAEGKINDLTLIYPQMSSSGDNPIQGMTGNDFVSNMKGILTDFKHDKNTVGFAPGPVGVESVFGQGRAQLLTQETDQVIRAILGVWGISKEVIYSGATYASMVVSVKLLASELATKRTLFDRFLNEFIKGHVNRLVDGANYTAFLAPFESADDIQKTSMMSSMKQQGAPITWASILKRVNVDYDSSIREVIKEERDMRVLTILQQKNQAEGQGEAQTILNHYSMEAEKLMFEAQGAEGQSGMEDPAEAEMRQAEAGQDAPAGDDPEAMGVQIAMMLLEKYGDNRASIDAELLAVSRQSPEVAQYAKRTIDQYLPPVSPVVGGAVGGDEGDGVDKRPAPEILPARRDGS